MKRIKLDIAEPVKNPPSAAKKPELPIVDDSSERYHQIIYINEGWRLCYDGLQYHVQQKRTRKKGAKAGEAYWKIKAYITNLDHAITYLARHRIYMASGVYECDALLVLTEALDQVVSDVKAALSELKKNEKS